MGHCLKKLENYLAKHAVPTFRDKPSPVNLNFYDTICILIISFISIVVHFWAFYKPYNIVSIEITNQFLNNQNNFSQNSFSQPLGNIIFSFLTAISRNDDGCNTYNNYECKDEFFFNDFSSSLQNNYQKNQFFNFLNEDNQITMRAISSLFSSFVPPLLYISIKLASFSRICASLSSLLLIFDTSILCEGKFSHPSGFLHFFVSLSLCFLTYWFSLFRNNDLWNKNMIFSSISIGIAVSIKSSACFLLFIVYFHEFIYLFIENNSKLSNQFMKSVLKRYAFFTFPVIVIHILFYLLQLILTIHHFNYKSRNFQSISKQNSLFLTFRLILTNCVLSKTKDFTQLKTIKTKSNHTLSPTNWIFISKLDDNLWIKCNQKEECERVVFIGNLFVYIFAFFGVIIVILAKSNRKYFRSSTFYLGYIFSFLPYLILSKCHFDLNSSDYLIPLMFGVSCFGISIDVIAARPLKGFLFVIALTFTIFGFNMWAPLVFAEKLGKHNFNLRVWKKAWLDTI
ncbi:hypothetical protein M9Y10_045229 [Tritrichomonas musculus]|uniref:ArnT-like N-terminal domain-containing protein n=1 Tax=Tritrichomonas musculus TaxID=1915356 RepID=A0ABR2JWI8_9EUKA